MDSFKASEREGCDRCGAFVITKMAQFHKCPGTDMNARPANIPKDKWLVHELNRVLGGVTVPAAKTPTSLDVAKQLIEQYREDLDAARKEVHELRMERIDHRGKIRTLGLSLALLAMFTVGWTIVTVWK